MSNEFGDYNLLLVLLSYGVSVAGAFTGLLMTGYIRRADGTLRVVWLGEAAIAIGGCGIWAMHFLGMMAYDPGVMITYDIVITAVSLVVPVVFTALGLYSVHRWHRSIPALLLAGTFMGAGVAAMHYTGMVAMRIPAQVSYDPALFAASVVIAIAASIVALLVLERVHGTLRFLSAPVLGLAVCGMHYTGMAAMRVAPVPGQVDYFTGAMTRDLIAVPVTVVALSACAAGIYMVTGAGAYRTA